MSWGITASVMVAGVCALFAGGCKAPEPHSHDHGSEAAKAEEEAPSLAFTRWTDRYELFVELPAPSPGKPVVYHAHVTRLDGFQAVTSGTFRARFRTAAGVAAEASIQGVKRPGIFVPQGPAPAAGSYTLEAVYEHDGVSEVFDCGQVVVAEPPVAPAEAPGSTITFLKESQWKIPFSTSWADERPLASQIELPATIEPAGSDQLTVGAPTGGRFFHNPKQSISEGLRVKKGDVIGSIVPTVAGDDYSRLQFAVEEARLTSEQLQREILRVEPLVQQQLLPERRLIELRNELESQQARLKSAAGRLGRVTASGGENGLPVKSTIEGVVAEVLVPNGEPVAGGAALVRIGGTAHVWLRARFVARPATTFLDAAPASARLPSGTVVDFNKDDARFLSALPVVEPSSRIATWIVDVAPTAAASASTKTELRPGSTVVVSVRLGKPENTLAVSKSAVVEINTRPYVFVQVDGEHFEKRPVTLGRVDGPLVQIVSGVSKGERVVDKGGFDIHLASLMGTIESHRH